jgi:hypothetical protein
MSYILKVKVSGRLVGQLSVYAVTNSDKEYAPLLILNTETSAFKKTFEGKIPEECKYKTVVINHNWIGKPLHVGGQIDVYMGGDISFDAPLTANIGSTKASSAKLTHNGVTQSCRAGGWIRHTSEE